MVRFVLILLVSILLITVLRSVIGLIMRGFGELFSTPSDPGKVRTAQPTVPAGGELKRDPVCGTYVSEATSIKRTVRGEVVHFCSPACRDKYNA